MRLDSDVKTVLETSTVDGNKLTLPGQLPRDLYVKVNKVLVALGGKWDRKAGGHLFEDDATDVVADAVATGVVTDFKKEFQFYETPEDVAKLLVKEAHVIPNMVCLEPSAGRGRIVWALDAVDAVIYACETMPQNYEVLAQMPMLLSILCKDFLTLQLKDCPDAVGFDRIVANPPFTRGQDMKHVVHMWELLKPGGRLVSVMSPAWTFHQSIQAKAFRSLVKGEKGVWKELPEGTFKASGTNVRTGYLVMDRRR